MLSRPNGAPIATTHSPTRVPAGSPIATTGRSFASIFSTAMSVVLSLPRTLAVNSRLSVSVTTTVSAPSTTCALVSTMPSGLTMKPEPRPRDGPSSGICGIGKLRKNGGSSSWSGMRNSDPIPSALPCSRRYERPPVPALRRGRRNRAARPAGIALATAVAAGVAAPAWRIVSQRSAVMAPAAKTPTTAIATRLFLNVFACIAFSLLNSYGGRAIAPACQQGRDEDLSLN